jgi:hypothetical protein
MNDTSFNGEEIFPPLPLEDWKETKNTLHLYLQIIGKIRLTLCPRQNHWWHAPLYVSTQGLTTRAIPYRFGSFEIEFDFINHRLNIITSNGDIRSFSLHDGFSVSEFYSKVFANLSALGIEVKILAVPYGTFTIEPFATDTKHSSYDKKYIEKFRQILISINGVFEEFRGWFIGKSTPVHLFWHSFDLALTRFSGKPAPIREGAGMVEREAYSHEVISFGFWAGDDNVKEPAFYSYTSPEPSGLTEEILMPEAAYWGNSGGGALALLKYDDIRRSKSPYKLILEFLESAYQAGAKTAKWDTQKFKLKPL